MPSSRPGRIAFAVVALVEGKRSEGIERALRASLKAGTLVERYDRQWRMARHSTRGRGRYVVGRIGFQMPGSLEEIWDERSMDFVERQLVHGTTSPFVIDLEHMRIAYQLRGGRIRPQTFIGNFQALLNEAAGNRWHWRVTPEVVGMPWPRWVEEVPRINEMRIRIERPNPNYKGRRRVEQLVEGAAAELITLVIRAREDAPGGVNIDDPFIAEAIDQADDKGNYSATGIQEVEGREVPVKWRSEVEGASIQRPVPVDPETREADPDTLRRELEMRSGEIDEDNDEVNDDDEDG